MNIIVAKLVCNTLVIGKLEDTCIKDVYSLNPVPRPATTPNTAPSIEVAFLPFMFPISTATQDIPLDRAILSIPAPADLEAKYIEITTGITVPKTSKIIH